jgi:hypothetical protein
MFAINNTVYTWVINSAVECLPYKQKVTGSNPVLPIKKYRPTAVYNVRILPKLECFSVGLLAAIDSSLVLDGYNSVFQSD